MLSLSVVEFSLCPDAAELLVLDDVMVDDDVVEVIESRHGSPAKPFARKSFVMRVVKGEGCGRPPDLTSGGMSEESKFASSAVGDGGIICNGRGSSWRRRPEPPPWILVELSGSPSRRRTSRWILLERYRYT